MVGGIMVEQQTSIDNTAGLKERLYALRQLPNFPEIPPVIREALEKLAQPDISFDVLEDVINRDPGLATYISRVVNSPLFKKDESEDVTMVSEALTSTDLSQLRSLLLTYAVGFLYRSVTDVKVREFLWHHALCVAVLSGIVAEETGLQQVNRAFDCGLVHDIGKIMLFLSDSAVFKEHLRIHRESEIVAEEEFKLFGISHIEAGHFLLGELGFDDEMKEVVKFHHNPEFSSSNNRMVMTTALANQLSYRLDEPTHKSLLRYLLRLNLTKAQLEKMADTGKKQVKKYLELF